MPVLMWFQYAWAEGKRREDFFMGIPHVPQPKWIPQKPVWEMDQFKKVFGAAGTGATENKSLDTSRNDTLEPVQPTSAAAKLKLVGDKLKRQMAQLNKRVARKPQAEVEASDATPHATATLQGPHLINDEQVSPFSDVRNEKSSKAIKKLSKEDFDNQNDKAYEADQN